MSEWEVFEKGRVGQRVEDPVFSVGEDDSIGLLASLYSEMGEPTAVKLYRDGDRLGFEPTHRGERNAKHTYVVTVQNYSQRMNSGSVGCGSAVREVGLEPGRYDAVFDEAEELWVLDPANKR